MQEPPAPHGPPAFDRIRDRTAVLNQLMLSAVVLALTVIVAVTPFPGSYGLFFAGALGTLFVAGVTLVVPWNRIALWWMALIPLADMVAVAVLRMSSPYAGFALLWIFPAMWLAGTFGAIGLLTGVATMLGLFALMVLADPMHNDSYITFLFPMVVLAVSATVYLVARRSAAQRSLLDKQADVLANALERTRRQEQEVTEVLDAVDFGVMRIDVDGTIAVTNEAHGRLQQSLDRGQGAAGAVAYQDDGVTPLPPGELPLARALRGEAFDGQLVWFGDPSGPRRVLSVTARRLTASSGDDIGAIVVSREVTAEMTALRARDELVASVSHELRTPLTSILGYLDLVVDDPTVPEGARHRLEIAERNAERLLGIIADILAASRAHRDLSAQLPINPVYVDVATVVRAAVESLQPGSAERGVRIDSSGVTSVHARVDPLRLRQVMDNLIANAIKYNHPDGAVVITTARPADEVVIDVHDTGVGLAASDRERLFQRFYRGRAVRGTGMTGTGLGLAISREIVRAHGGDITVCSELGVGSTFTVRLPAAASRE
ncbi:sensor histidine kinase [Microbacterium kribbense]|uniref:histidine kinase n=1 Tax=Microbacterium kribbense TaxID=433645 RepID=A0ABP7GMP8_9MICO